MALLFNTSSPIIRSYSSSSQHKYFGKTKLFGLATRSAPKQHYRRYAVSSSTTHLQEYHFDPNDVVFQENFEDEYEEKIEKIRELVEWREEEDPMERLMLVDAIQRLGVGHHFEKEIEMSMKQHYLKTISGSHSLHHVALSFRLLRQRGYHVSADVLNNFKGKDGKFRDDLKQDIWGLLELYEATQLSFEGESILEEAADFSRQILYQRLASDLDMKLKELNIVGMRLTHPYHKSITKITSKDFPSEVGGMDGWMTALTELSELDFLRRKHIYKHELLQFSKWWNDEDLNRELKLARNQPLKWYTWSMAILMDDISLSEQRVQLTKSIAFIYLLDDVFDLYGALDDLEIFSEAVNKWEYAAIDMLPEYMKLCYKSLLDTTNQIATTIYENHGYNPINILKQTWGSLCNAFLEEAKWLASKELPRAQEYLANGEVSSGVHVVLVHLFSLLGLHEANLGDVSNLISRVAAILRLWDDLGSAEDEHQEGRDGSYIECYMRDKPGLEFEEAREHVVEMIEMEWKRLNKECFNLSNQHRSSSSHDQFQEGALNLARMVPLMYSYDHNQRLPLLKQYVQTMLLDPPSSELSHILF